MIAKQLYQINVKGAWITVTATEYMKFVGEKRVKVMIGEREWNAKTKGGRLAA